MFLDSTVMYRQGHLGVSLLSGSPIMLILLYNGLVTPAIIFIGLVAVLSTYPDMDLDSSYFTHRGFTHTVWFGVILGVTISFICLLGFFATNYVLFEVKQFTGIQTGTISDYINPFTVLVTVFFAGFSSVVFHTLGDVPTPSGVSIAPPYIDEHGFGWFNADNKVANRCFLYLGVFAFGFSCLVWWYGAFTVFGAVLVLIYIPSVPVVVLLAAQNQRTVNRNDDTWIDWVDLRGILH